MTELAGEPPSSPVPEPPAAPAAPAVPAVPVARAVARALPAAARALPAIARARSYRLVRGSPLRRPAFDPDEAQRRVVAHRRGPLLVLAGPGTGKTTTLVEAVARRVERGLRPEQVLVLTFSRRAALELRERLTARLQRALPGPLAWTFHAWCYALVRQAHPFDGLAEPPRLLSGPEQDVVLRDLLRGSLDTGRPRWPATMRPAMGTRGLAEEVRALLSRARDVGVDPGELAVLAAWEGRDDWSALADFYADYLDVLDAQGALDYADLVSRAVALASRPEIGRALRSNFRAVFVDEYQDTDPSQERLLHALAGRGGDLVVVGDPDQAIYGFRGADVKGLLQFRDRFRRSDGQPAPVLALQTCRRSGSALVAATRRVAWGIPAPGLPAQTLLQHRELAATSTGGGVEVATYPSPGAEAEAVADVLRRERLERGTEWAQMAVLFRSGVRSVPVMRRVLTAAGIPVQVAGDEVPLAREPAIVALLLALRCAADPAALAPQTARDLMTSPLVAADAAQLRRLGRALRAADRGQRASDPSAPSRVPRPSGDLLREAVADPSLVSGLPGDLAGPVLRLAGLLGEARSALEAGGGPEAALWSLWSGSPWSARLERASAAGGPAGRSADRDLDVVVALFTALGRAAERRGRFAGVGPLLDELEAQQIPAHPLAEREVGGDAVRLLTAHRSKGLEWEVVVVCGVQEGVWPDLRRRSCLLDADRLDTPQAGGVRAPLCSSELLADERRLFYVACTRARRRLVVTAVSSADDTGERPSRFLAELGVHVREVRERVPVPLSVPALVATLRRLGVDPGASPALRRAAATRLARLAVLTDAAGRRLVPAATPDRWWGMATLSRNDTPVRDPGQPVPLSGTSLALLGQCPLRWFLEHEARARGPASSEMGLGGVVHALADDVARGRSEPDLDMVLGRLDTVWEQLAYDAPWRSAQEREAARAAIGRFLAWHAGTRNRELAGSEVDFSVVVGLPSGRVLLRGCMDRVEIERSDGRVHVVDLKTMKNPPSRPEVERHPQLGVYQLAVRAGALDRVPPDGGSQDAPGESPGELRCGGAELVQLRADAGGLPKVQCQPPLDSEPAGLTWIEDLLETGLRLVLSERFPATPGEHCRWCTFRASCPAQPEGRAVVE